VLRHDECIHSADTMDRAHQLELLVPRQVAKEQRVKLSEPE
jgi:hypothetical protein